MTTRGALAAGVLVVAAVLSAGCGGRSPSPPVPDGPAAETNPAGDIPDNQVFVAVTAADGLITLTVPQGWAQTTAGTATTFTDKSNRIIIDTVAVPVAPTVDSAEATELPAIAATTPGFAAGIIRVVPRRAGDAVLITYQATSEPNPVTGKTGTDAVERYEFWRDGHEVMLTLSGPRGADNVDPWRIVTDSLHWQ